jgi:hypothetical protein
VPALVAIIVASIMAALRRFLAVVIARLGTIAGQLVAAFVAWLATHLEEIIEWIVAHTKDDLENYIKSWIVEEVRKRWDVNLDPVDPLSKESISNAVAQKLAIPGLHIRDFTNRALLVEDIQTALTGQINQRAGTSLTAIYPPELLIDGLRSEFYLQVEKAFAGQSSLLSRETINLMAQRISQYSGRTITLGGDNHPGRYDDNHCGRC